MNTAIVASWAFGIYEIILILAIVLLLFGASRIPEVAKSLGKGVSEFKKGLKGEEPEPPKVGSSNPPAIEDKK